MATTTKRGGPRPNSGRPRHPTKVLRLPLDIADMAQRLAARSGNSSGIGEFLKGEARTKATSPLMTVSVACGFPSPAEDHLEKALDLNELHGIGRTEIFLLRSAGESMIGRGIYPNDILVVNRALEPKNGCIVVACVNGESTLKTFIRRGNRITLQAENPAFPNIDVPEQADFFVWGVVTGITRVF